MGAKTRIKHFLSETKRRLAVLSAHKYTTLAGSLSFFLITSLVPFLFLLALFFGETVLDRLPVPDFFGWLRTFWDPLRDNAERAARGAGMLLFLTAVWSGSGFFFHLRRCGEIAYGYPRVKHGWKVRISAILFTFALLLELGVAATLLWAGTAAVRALPALIRYPLWAAVLFLLGFFTAWILNVYVCPYRVRPSDTAGGSVLTACLWLLCALLFTLVLRFTDREKLYGALAALIAFVLFLYWMMVCLMVGIVYCQRRLERRGRAHKRL